MLLLHGQSSMAVSWKVSGLGTSSVGALYPPRTGEIVARLSGRCLCAEKPAEGTRAESGGGNADMIDWLKD